MLNTAIMVPLNKAYQDLFVQCMMLYKLMYCLFLYIWAYYLHLHSAFNNISAFSDQIYDFHTNAECANNSYTTTIMLLSTRSWTLVTKAVG